MRYANPIFALALLAACAAPSFTAETSFPLHVSPNGRYLVDHKDSRSCTRPIRPGPSSRNVPSMRRASNLAARKAQGFTVIQVNLTGSPGRQVPEDQRPFGGDNDFSRPNEKFFQAADSVIEKARALNLGIALVPLWAGCCREGWAGRGRDGALKPLNVNGPDKVREFGRWLGRRYARFPNVTWILGGDNDPHESVEEYRQLGLGLMETAPLQLRTYHPSSSHSATDVWPNEQWLNLSMVYTYFRGFNKAWNKDQPDVYEISYAEYNRSPARPFILGESTYEGEHGDWGSALQARKQAYWVMLSGGAGHAYGSPVWNFPRNWRESMALPGAGSLKHLGELFAARPWYDMVPDQKNELAVDGRGPYGRTTTPPPRSHWTTASPSPIFRPSGELRTIWPCSREAR